MYGNYAPFYRPGYFNPMQAMPPQNIPDNTNQFAPRPMQTVLQPVTDMIWVLNENEATSYPVAPNNTVTLWDKNLPTIYIKSVDANGVPSMRTLDFTERTANAQKNAEEHICQCGSKFVKIEDFKALESKLEDLTSKFEEMKSKSIIKTKKAEVEIDG